MTLKCLKIDFYANKIANFLGTSAKMSYNLCRPFYILKNIRRPKSEISTYVDPNISLVEHPPLDFLILYQGSFLSVVEYSLW